MCRFGKSGKLLKRCEPALSLIEVTAQYQKQIVTRDTSDLTSILTQHDNKSLEVSVNAKR